MISESFSPQDLAFLDPYTRIIEGSMGVTFIIKIYGNGWDMLTMRKTIPWTYLRAAVVRRDSENGS